MASSHPERKVRSAAPGDPLCDVASGIPSQGHIGEEKCVTAAVPIVRVAARAAHAAGSIAVRIWAKAARRPVDSFAILAAGLASIVIIVNAVFLQSGSHTATDELEALTSKLQELQEFLKSEAERVQREIKSAMAGHGLDSASGCPAPRESERRRRWQTTTQGPFSCGRSSSQ